MLFPFQFFQPKERVFCLFRVHRTYSFHSVHSAIGIRMNRMISRLFRKRNSSQKNTNTVYSEYSRTCIKRSPSIKRSVVKVPKITSLNYCNFTSIKRSRSPFAKSRRAVSIVLTCIKWPLCKRKPLKYYSGSYKYKQHTR